MSVSLLSTKRLAGIEPQRTYLFYVAFRPDPNEAVERLIQKASVPLPDMTDLVQRRVGSRAEYSAGRFEVDKVRLSFLLTEDSPVVPYFEHWRKQVVGESGLVYSPRNVYQRDFTVYVLDTHGSWWMQLVVRNAFPVGYPKFEMAYGSHDEDYIGITFQPEWVDVVTGRGRT